MKRIIGNSIRALVIIGIVFLAVKFYAPPGVPIKGATNQERAIEIADKVTDKYQPYVAVVSAELGKDESGQYLAFGVRWNLQRWINDNPNADPAVYSEAVTALRGSIVDLLKLGMEHIAANDPLLGFIRIQLVLPDGSILQTNVSAAQLAAIPEDAEDDAWFERFFASREAVYTFSGSKLADILEQIRAMPEDQFAQTVDNLRNPKS